MAALRARHPRGLARPLGPRRRLQRGLLCDRDEAARRRSRARRRLRRALPRAGALRRGSGRRGRRVPPHVGLPVAVAAGALRYRAVHGRALSPPASPARAQHPARLRHLRPAHLPVDAPRRRRGAGLRQGLRVLAGGSFPRPRLSHDVLRRASLRARPDQLVDSQSRLRRSDAAQRRFRPRRSPGGGSVHLPSARRRRALRRGAAAVVEAVMIWNEPNNLSHWDFEIDPGWQTFAEMAKTASAAIAAEKPTLPRVLGGISPIDPGFLKTLEARGVLDALDVVAVHGFPLDWNHWQIQEWPDKLAEVQAVTNKPVWISEVGVSTFGAEEVQEFGLRRTAELLNGRADRIHWYSLYDLPKAWAATTRHREAEGSSYYRHFYMGLLREDGSPKLALRQFAEYTPEMGICQWFHFEDHRLDAAVDWLRRLGVRRLRTGLSWADGARPNAERWFDRQMKALEEFEVTLTYCFTPEAQGLRADHTSPPRNVEEFADFCG